MKPYTIIRITEEIGAEPGGMPSSYIRVDFKVGDDGPFTYRLRRVEYKPELMRQHIEKFAREIESLRS